MSKKLKKKKAAPLVRIRCTECNEAVPVNVGDPDITRAFWKAGKWLLSSDAFVGADGTSFVGALQPMCPACQDVHMDSSALAAARKAFSSRYDIGVN